MVDLADPEARLAGLHPRFGERVFTAAERHALAGSRRPERLHWALWAAKESAYKALRQLDPDLAFSPGRLEVSLDAGRLADRGRSAGRVRGMGRVLELEVHSEADRVHAIARTGVPARVVWATGPGGDESSGAVRRLALESVARALGLDASTLRVDGRPPLVSCGGERLALALSLSHHGRFVAFAAALPATSPGPRPSCGC